MLSKICFITLFSLLSSSVFAEWYFQPKIGYEIRNIKFKFGESKGTASIPSTIMGFSVVNSNGYYFDADLSGGNDEVSGYYPEDDYIERYDFTLSIGYSLGDGLTIFGGINTADTQAQNQKGQAVAQNEIQIVSEGPFVGLAKRFSINKNNSVTASLAAGMMEGEIQDDTMPSDITGDSVGYSASLSYTHRIQQISITTGVKSQSYTYSNMTTEDGAEQPDATDEMTSVFVKASYTFM